MPSSRSPSPPRFDRPPTAALEVHLLGLVDFDSARRLQERLAFDLSGRDDRHGTLLLCEHPPVVTIGREGSRGDLPCDAHEWVSREIEVRWVPRGGPTLLHAPGQLAVYPLVPLDRLGLGLGEYRTLLEDSALAVCREHRIAATRSTCGPGVRGRTGRLAAVGTAVRSWIALHGLFVNVSPAMHVQRLVSGPEPVGSLAAERQGPVSMHSVREGFVRHLAERLGYDRFHVYTGHPLLARTRRKVPVHA